MSVITVPRTLRDKLGEEGTEAFVEVIHSVESESRRDLPTKEDFANFKGEMKEDFANFRGEMKEDFAKLDGNLRLEIEKSKSDIIKWVAAMLVAQSAVIAALVKILGVR